MFVRILCIIFLSFSVFSFDFDVKNKLPEIFRAYEYSSVCLEIKNKDGYTISSVLPPKEEKIVIKPSYSKVISKDDGSNILFFEFIFLPKEKGKFNLKPFQILYFEGEPKDEEPKIFEYNLGEIKVKGKYFYKNLYFWYFAGFLILILVIIFIFYFRRSYGKRDRTSQGQA